MTDAESTRELIVKYLNHSCTEEELKEFLEMMKDSTASVPELDAAAREYWEKEPEEALTDEIYGRYRQDALRLIRKHSFGRRLKERWKVSRRIAAVAASIALVAGAGYFIISDVTERRTAMQLASYSTMETQPGQRRMVELPDGTRVTLNVASSIRYNARYGKDTRDVWLSGEAFFDVESDPECPFLIHAGDLDVRVTGTSFNVNAYPEDRQASVTVKSGKVAVSYGDDDVRMNLHPDEQLVIDTENQSIFRGNAKTGEVLSWMRGTLTFRQQTLPEILKTLRRYYSCNIELRDTTSKVKLSGTHDNKSLESVLQSICFSAGLEYRKEGNKYIIY